MKGEVLKRKFWSFFKKKIKRIHVVAIQKPGSHTWIKIKAKADTGAKNNSIDFSLAEEIGYYDLVHIFKKLEPAILRERKKGAKIKKLNELFLPQLPGAQKLVVIISSHGASVRLQVPIILKIKGRKIKTSANIYARKKMKIHLLLGQSVLKYFFISI